MDNPSSFVSFADYLGLNDEDGQLMLEKTLAPAEKMRDDAQGAMEEQNSVANTWSAGEKFDAAEEKARAGLASYGEYMQGMSDPAARQALMEKVYGKSSVSRFDEALMGGNNRLAPHAAAAKQFQEQAAARAGRLRTTFDLTKKSHESQVAYDAKMAEAKKKYLEDQAKRRAEDEENLRADSFGRQWADREGGPYEALGRTWSGGYDLLNTKKDFSMTQRDWAKREMAKWEAGDALSGPPRKYKTGEKV